MLVRINDNARAVESGLDMVRLLGSQYLQLDMCASTQTVQFWIDSLFAAMAERNLTIESLRYLPTSKQWELEALVATLYLLVPPAYMAGQIHWYGVFSTVPVVLSIRHGNTAESPSAYAAFGFLLAAVYHRYHEAYRFGAMSLALCEQTVNGPVTANAGVAAPPSRASAILEAAMVTQWGDTYEKTLRVFEQSFTAHKQAGLFVYGAHPVVMGQWMRWSGGTPMNEQISLYVRRMPYVRTHAALSFGTCFYGLFIIAVRLADGTLAQGLSCIGSTLALSSHAMMT
jgi:hypothetical protein